jgi:ribosomal protein L29
MSGKKIKANQESDLTQLVSLRKDLMNLRFQKANAQLVDTSQMKKKKKAIAKLLTLFNIKK